ncbi:MAG: right-handed parallel beta-helix repeat-containing protein [Chromatiales bacterium]|nr:right-handed parallel beta-helix repeat-containing protein [Chromatiales bacterium]
MIVPWSTDGAHDEAMPMTVSNHAPRGNNWLASSLASGALLAALAFPVIAGPLDPPAPPAPTDAVQLPGTAIASAPFTIAAPGRYYLTRNIVSPGAQVAISVAADNVIIDLGGFTLGGNDAVGSFGIRLSGDRVNVTVVNGVVRDFQIGLDSSGFLNRFMQIRQVAAYSNVRGFSLLGTGITLTDCVAADNTESGIYFPADRSVIRNCHVQNNGSQGITLGGNQSLIERNLVRSNSAGDISVQNNFNTVRENVVGLLIISGSNNSIIDNVCAGLTNTGSGNVTAATSHQNVGC